jgi:hypothetical protein
VISSKFNMHGICLRRKTQVAEEKASLYAPEHALVTALRHQMGFSFGFFGHHVDELAAPPLPSHPQSGHSQTGNADQTVGDAAKTPFKPDPQH